jgi:hypothetical protein
MVQQPEELNRHYFDLFVRTLKDHMPRYDRVEKMAITPYGTAEMPLQFDLNTGLAIPPPTPGRLSDYVRFSEQLSTVSADPMVEAEVRRFAEQLATTIESLIAETSRYGSPICSDLIALSDGSKNLQTIYCVKGNEVTVDDMTGSITGWFAYKLRYAVGTKCAAY